MQGAGAYCGSLQLVVSLSYFHLLIFSFIHLIKVKVKVHTLDIAPLLIVNQHHRSAQVASMARVLKEEYGPPVHYARVSTDCTSSKIATSTPASLTRTLATGSLRVENP